MLKPQAFCFNLKFASIDRYNVLSLILQEYMSAMNTVIKLDSGYLSVLDETRFLPGWGHAGQSRDNDPGPNAWKPLER